MDSLTHSTSMFIGETTGGIAQPVFYDTHTPIMNNMPPGSLITGAPGSGKTFLGCTIAALSALLGKTTIILDPKGDFIGLAGIQDQIGKINLWNLGAAGARARPGVLDPFNMSSDKAETLTIVLSVIDLFVGGLKDEQMNVLAPIVQDVIELQVPSLLKVVEMLRGSERLEARSLGTKLGLISQTSIAKICFSPGSRKQGKLSLDKGVTVITLAGLELPADPEEARNTNSGRLVSGLLYLVTDFIRRLMFEDTSGSPKTLIIDEAWAVLASEQGANVIKSVALLGRSRALSLTLITQNTSHLSRLDIENTITTRFAFRTAQSEAADIVAAMDLPRNEGFERVLTGLGKGECLMQDFRGRASTVQISRWREDWADAFNSNPFEKKKIKEEKNKKSVAPQ